MNSRPQLAALSALLLASSLTTYASSQTFESIESGIKQIWDRATLYENKDNAFIQKVAFTGRLQYDIAQFDNSEGDDQYTDEWRRTRAGFKVSFLDNFLLHSVVDMDWNDQAPIYKRLTFSYIGWDSGNDWGIKVGKIPAAFTLDGAVASTKLYRTERSLLAGNFWFGTEYFTGISASGESEEWQWRTGLFSNVDSPEFDNSFDASYFTLLSLGYDFAGRFDADRALLRLDYVYQDEADPEDVGLVGTLDHEHTLSLNYQYDADTVHLHADLAYSKGFDGNELIALQLMPFYDLNKTFQVVGSYTYVRSSDDAVVSLSRYAMPIANAASEEAHEFYFGLNTYLYGHQVKWQNGIEYAVTDGDEYDGIGFTSAIRLSW